MSISNLSTATDEDLVQAIREDDRNALGELYNRFYKRVFHKCYSFTKNHEEAFDLAQESLLKAFDNIHSFKGESTFSTWLYTITHRHCLAALKKKGRFHFHSLEDSIFGEEVKKNDASRIAEESNERSEQELIMYSLINALPQKEKDLLNLKYLRGESIENLQSQLNISGSAVKMRLKRTREKLNALYVMALTYGLDQVLEQIELFTVS
jgi:RNA polymerase sigma-70 factor (ECF subfamily)